MKVQLPFLKGYETKTLFILGNGFDLYHGALSKYKHFFCWLNLNGYEDFATQLQHLFPCLENKADILWCNFEDALGNYDVNKIYGYMYQKPDYAKGGIEWAVEANKAVDRVRNICTKIRPLMKKWANNINIEHLGQKIELPEGSWYLTFNYTEILERVYGIPHEHICHIHGSISDEEEIITGHNYIMLKTASKSKSDEEEDAKMKINKIIGKLEKDKEGQIEKNETFFLSLHDIEHVVVMGHSLADIDLYYFGKVLSSVSNDTIWHFSLHSEEDRNKIKLFKQKCIAASDAYKITLGEFINL